MSSNPRNPSNRFPIPDSGSSITIRMVPPFSECSILDALSPKRRSTIPRTASRDGTDPAASTATGGSATTIHARDPSTWASKPAPRRVVFHSDRCPSSTLRYRDPSSPSLSFHLTIIAGRLFNSGLIAIRARSANFAVHSSLTTFHPGIPGV